MSDLSLTFVIIVAFPLSGQRRPPQIHAPKAGNTVEFNTQPGSTSVNASMRKLPDASHHSTPRRLARSYLVRLFHSRPFSGLRRRTLTPFLFSNINLHFVDFSAHICSTMAVSMGTDVTCFFHKRPPFWSLETLFVLRNRVRCLIRIILRRRLRGRSCQLSDKKSVC